MAGKETVIRIKLQLEDGRAEEFNQKSVIIGSGPAANLRVENDSVSSIHAILRAGEEDNTALISDLGSDQGTRVNDREIQREAVVKCGDRLQLGGCELKVMAIGAAEAKAAEEPVPKEATPVERPPRKPPRAAPPPLKEVVEPPLSSHTEIVRRREIPRTDEILAAPSGQNFFQRGEDCGDRADKSHGAIEVKVSWGPIVLHSGVFSPQQPITVGDSDSASIRMVTGREGEEKFTLVEPGGHEGCVVHVASGMKFEVRKSSGQVEDGDKPSSGAVRTYNLLPGERCRVNMGQLAFVIQFVAPAQGVLSGKGRRSDLRLTRWVAMLLVLAVSLWVLILMTPRQKAEASEYLKNPARFAKLIMPTSSQDKKKTFEEIKKKKEEKPVVEDTGKWKKVTTKSRQKESADVPREVKQAQDRKVATNAGILGLLKGRGGGTGDDASSVFGGSAMANLDQSLAGLQSSGMGDSSGFGGLGIRGGGIGGGGGGLGLGGLGTGGYGRGSGEGYGSIKIGQRGKQNVKVVKGRTKVVGGLSQEVVGRYIQRYWNQFKYCYERELTKDPNLYGKITMTFTISGNGRVGDASVIQTTMNNANVEECVLRVVRRIRFPEPKGGGEVIVTYPFMFTTAG